MNEIMPHISWANTYVAVVRYAGKKARATGDKTWVGLYFAGLAVGIAWTAVSLAAAIVETTNALVETTTACSETSIEND